VPSPERSAVVHGSVPASLNNVMAPSNSSTKKLAKVARSGKKRTIRESSDRTYPLAVAAIVVVGSLMVFWGRSVRVEAQNIEPKLSDHWHAAYGTYLCDNFAPPPADAGPDKTGIHSHQDGIIHIHPFSSAAAGEKATIGKFYETVGMQVSDGKLVTADGSVYESGTTTCPDGQVGKLVLVEWQSADDPAATPKVITKDIADTRFVNDRMVFTLAFVPEDKIADIPKPESIPNLDNLSDVQGSQSTVATLPGDGSSTTVADGSTPTTTAEGATSTTTAGATTTVAPTPSSAVATTTTGR